MLVIQPVTIAALKELQPTTMTIFFATPFVETAML
jgi:hypothetical protein